MNSNQNNFPLIFLLTSLLILTLVLSYNHIEKLEELIHEQQETIETQQQAIDMQRLHNMLMNRIYSNQNDPYQ